MRDHFLIQRNCFFKGGCLIAAICALVPLSLKANPHGGTVAQGSATFNNSGSQLTITTSDHAYINWQSFNIGLGESTTFVQPSSSSLVWNHINDASPSQILGNLSANGYVVLQNQNGFYVGGQASITAHGLIMATAPIPMPDLSSGGAWSFSAPPPTAAIVNYGQINVGQGGAYLIAHDIENHGSISAAQGDIGLYAGQTVLLSQRPDGRGLSASVTLPEGSVDNSGKLIADAGTISLQAQVVNQGGLIQANSVRNVNGKIELIASDSINLGAGSVISAKGDSQGVSPGGSVVIKSGNTFSDASGSVIDVAGGAQGGNGGVVEISSANLAPFLSQINARAAGGFAGGALTLDPNDILLDDGMIDSLNLQIAGGVSQINLQADDITVGASTTWTLSDLASAGSLTLSAGNNLILNSSISAGKNWDLNLFAGTAFSPSAAQPKPASGSDGVYLNGNSFIESRNGNINISAANEVLVNSATDGSDFTSGIRTRTGGNISVTAQYGDVNTGLNAFGYSFTSKGPTVSPSVGGISTVAGGNVNITAGGDVISFPAFNNVTTDAGSGAFGASPGNVTVTAGGSVYGHFVVAHGNGIINAGGDIGNAFQNVSLSLVNGSWKLNAPNGNIYLQEVRNPNGIFNEKSGAISHLFDYDPLASVSLNAGIGVDLTGANLPRGAGNSALNLQLGPILPPILSISAGSGGLTMEKTFILFPSPYQDLDIQTGAGGNFTSLQADPLAVNYLIMSDSAQRQALTTDTFGLNDHSGVSLLANNHGTATIKISGSMENINLVTSIQTDIKVGGDMINCSFSGQNLHPGDVTSIDVAGQIFDRSAFTFTFLDASIPIIPFADLPPGVSPTWETVFTYAVDADIIANLTVPTGTSPDQYLDFVRNKGANVLAGLQGEFLYNPTTRKLGFAGTMSPTDFANLLKPITVLVFDPGTGKPELDKDSRHFVTATLNDGNPLISPGSLTQLYYASHDPHYGANNDPGVDPANLPTVGAPASASTTGLIIDGPGQFNVHAGSMDLGNSRGILSEGIGRSYDLVPFTKAGADTHVTTDGNLSMITSAIGSLFGGNIYLNVGGSIDLGALELATATKQNAGILGVYTTEGGEISVIANGNVNVNGSRIAAFNGGDIYVKSLTGNVDVGDGKSGVLNYVTSYYVVDGVGYQSQQYIYGSGILASTPYDNLTPGSALIPGDITIETPRGDILSSLGGILQIALNHNFTAGPKITLTAGTKPSDGFPGYVGNIDLGAAGVIGGDIKATASGNITGLFISRGNTSITAAQTAHVTVLSSGHADVTGESITGTIVGVKGVNASGDSITATMLGQNVSANGGASQSTLGTTATASSTSESAANQSSNDTKEQVASNDTDDDEKKKKGKQPRLTHWVGRVTIILPAA